MSGHGKYDVAAWSRYPSTHPLEAGQVRHNGCRSKAASGGFNAENLLRQEAGHAGGPAVAQAVGVTLQALLEKLDLALPQQPPPKIYACQLAALRVLRIPGIDNPRVICGGNFWPWLHDNAVFTPEMRKLGYRSPQQ